ncbi:methylated-DNA--[protein]-cysteine S-methyltransferase [Amycolatopsis magusensis]|uniref:Methylated-DNA--protein-cysteine methyltransferase n=1 Tax=Amycolatopsis magusensis TaxID=882444 RepID=A0ABS4Q096_9PSEU|nr:methylated-DNA--[protein]-cysteine S-methyltransferase [Amycolatopsis magusensis]MBP2185088.1 methylated-DNA-[protein]-cysteine S-methyltransferase [Amycolatopsis magusensis]MDI5982103.1 methylated-DNA--[protein]-cysteine S-methyltransferase [Amycolatopsis magusensis]
MTTRVHTVVDSPIGELTLVAVGDRLAGLYMEEQRHRPPDERFGTRDETPFAETTSQLKEYFAGQRTEFDLPLHFDGTEFQRAVWTELCRIPFGDTVSYAELAARVGRPSAVRAVGAANGRNPISIVVPCHRVIGSGGSLTGYGGGLPRKQFLLAFEGVPGQLQLG